MLLACNSYITLRISNLIGQGLPCHGSRCRFESDLIRRLFQIMLATIQIVMLMLAKKKYYRGKVAIPFFPFATRYSNKKI